MAVQLRATIRKAGRGEMEPVTLVLPIEGEVPTDVDLGRLTDLVSAEARPRVRSRDAWAETHEPEPGRYAGYLFAVGRTIGWYDVVVEPVPVPEPDPLPEVPSEPADPVEVA